jgi:hypothetical protein
LEEQNQLNCSIFYRVCRSIYRKWNSNLFEEMYEAYASGRSSKDPSDGWYEGELKFFDSHVIPLAKSLNTCGCFGVGGDEFLTNAVQNRDEWVDKGRQIVAEMVAEVQAKCGKNTVVKAQDSVASHATSQTTETRQCGAVTCSSGPQIDDSQRSEEFSLSDVFQDELEIGMNGSVGC